MHAVRVRVSFVRASKVARDPAATHHKYESSATRVLIVLRLLLGGWFAWCVHRSYHHEFWVNTKSLC